MELPERNFAKELFEAFCDGYNRRDLNFLIGLFTYNTYRWGTAEDEYVEGLVGIKTQLQRDWSQSEKSEMHIHFFVPAPFGANWAAAVFQVRVTIGGKEFIFDHLRGTLIAEVEDGDWKIAHMHASFPDYRTPKGGSFPVLESVPMYH